MDESSGSSDSNDTDADIFEDTTSADWTEQEETTENTEEEWTEENVARAIQQAIASEASNSHVFNATEAPTAPDPPSANDGQQVRGVAEETFEDITVEVAAMEEVQTEQSTAGDSQSSNATDGTAMALDLARIQQGAFPGTASGSTNEARNMSVPHNGAEDSNQEQQLADDRASTTGNEVPFQGTVTEPTTHVYTITWVDTNTEPSAVSSSSQQNKRRRTATPPPTAESEVVVEVHDEEDATVCSICLDDWTMSGDHRVVSLKCGHLFGMSCIKRWLQSNPAAQRNCATCKRKATMGDIRPIYAKAIRAIDNTREQQLERSLNALRRSETDLQVKVRLLEAEVEQLRQLSKQQREMLQQFRGTDPPIEKPWPHGMLRSNPNYMLFLEKNIEISREPGCRAMAYAGKHQLLLISQKSGQGLFPGYAVRFLSLVDQAGSKIGSTMWVSPRSIRDIAVDASDDLFACATMEPTVKIFSVPLRCGQASITPASDACIWSCAFDKDRAGIVYLGGHRGTVYVYNIRQPTECLQELKSGSTQNDLTAVIKICSLETTPILPHGGILVCKLKSVWLYAHTADQHLEPYLINVEGPFSSMSYSATNGIVMLTIRSTADRPSVILLAKLEKTGDHYSLNILHRYEGSRVQTAMLRNAQIPVSATDSLVASYLEDVRKLAVWGTHSGSRRLQQLPLVETIVDICPIVGEPGNLSLAALSDTRCRIYRITYT
ncbi:E3 ubiquitin-protein ligase RFWD3-like [Anopheles albimanus]|uniref:RING-type E3 ubiquitin transferase n=1 Tax=Anopheles albimanus TaxID=7167 RepID=A0A182FC88_ANOAL|nr:E3 ubiquitin-protein ligase RFWD3-like [Anopheles albimanus]